MSPTTSTRQTVQKPSQTALRVLIAEDDEAVQHSLIQAVTELGHQVVAITSNGNEAIEIALQKSLDLMIMDISLPGMDGLTAAEQILKQTSIPLIVSTGMVEDDMLDRAQAIDVQSYLTKPFTLSQLKSAIRISVALHARQHTRDYELELLRKELSSFPVIDRAISQIMTTYGDDRRNALIRLASTAKERQATLTDAAHYSLSQLAQQQPG